jgi:hypothetical protein
MQSPGRQQLCGNMSGWLFPEGIYTLERSRIASADARRLIALLWRARCWSPYGANAFPTAIPVLCVLFQIDLRQDGADELAAVLAEKAGVAQQVRGVPRHVPPGATPFDNEEHLVCHGREQPRLGDGEERRAIDDDTVVAVAQLSQEAGHVAADERQQRIARAATHRQVIEIQTGDVLDRRRRRPVVKQKRVEDSRLRLAPELA